MMTIPGSMETRALPRIKRTYMRPRIVAFIPAHNEEKSIHDCLTGLKEQVLPSGVDLDVFVVADNCTDRTEEVAKETGEELGLSLQIIVTENNKQRKVGALNAVWKAIYGDNMDIYEMERTDFEIAYQRSVKGILGMDADSRLAPRALQHLWDGLMSSRNIGGVMAKYTMRMPKKKSLLSKDDPYYEEKLASGEYGGPMSRWWTHQQKQDMASWLLSLQYRGGSTYVLGGQATLFRPEALYEVMQSNKLDGPWQNDTDVEDMLLTWQLQKNGWKTLISPNARCFVDAMRSYHTFRNQRVKWSSGTVNLLTDRDLMMKTRHTGHLWRSQLKTMMDLLVRVFFVLLLGAAIATDQFLWSWVWVIPIALASVLNTILALKTPMNRPIDVILAFLLISPELYLWVNLMTFAQVWTEKLSNDKKDGWANQYQAEAGNTRSKLLQGVLALLLFISIAVFACYYFRDYLTSEAVQQVTNPYLMAGWIGLTGLTVFMSFIMLYQIWTLRTRHRA